MRERNVLEYQYYVLDNEIVFDNLDMTVINMCDKANFEFIIVICGSQLCTLAKMVDGV